VALEKVAALVKGLARDRGAPDALRTDPARLVAKYRLTAGNHRALASADRFFKTEQPIVPKPTPPRRLKTRAVPAPRAGTMTASADTGTLLPGPNTGTYTSTGTISITSLPQPPAPAAPAPGVAPTTPAAPSAPMLPIPGPAGPAPPYWVPSPYPTPYPTPYPAPCPMPYPTPYATPVGPAPGAWPTAQPLPYLAPQMPFAAMLQNKNCCCESAVVAMTAVVSAAAQAAITAITAIASQRCGG
jgi:hypothetical protein